MPPGKGVASYADGLRNILSAISDAMAAPDADIRALMPLQLATLATIKQGPGGGQGGAMQGQQAPGQPGGGMMGSPGAPAMAGPGQQNPSQVTPTAPRGMMAQPGMGGPGGMAANPDELRRLIQSQAGA